MCNNFCGLERVSKYIRMSSKNSETYPPTPKEGENTTQSHYENVAPFPRNGGLAKSSGGSAVVIRGHLPPHRARMATCRGDKWMTHGRA